MDSRHLLFYCAGNQHLGAFLAQLAKQERYSRELQLLNQYADKLNEEALDVLDYQ